MSLKPLTESALASLVRAGVVRGVLLVPYPLKPGSWALTVQHADLGMTPDLYTQRGKVRAFKTLEAALSVLRACGFSGRASMDVLPPGQ